MPTKRNPQTDDEMMTAALEKRQSKLYRRETSEFNDEMLGGLIRRTADELEAQQEKISLTDTATVKRITRKYLLTCEAAAIIPSISGLANALGCTRQALYDVINRGSPPETAEFLTRVHDSFSDLLSQAALRGATSPVPSIFLLKSLFGLREAVEVIATKKEDYGPLGPAPDLAALEEKFGIVDIVVEED